MWLFQVTQDCDDSDMVWVKYFNKQRPFIWNLQDREYLHPTDDVLLTEPAPTMMYRGRKHLYQFDWGIEIPGSLKLW